MPTAPWAPWAFVGWRNVSQLLIREQRFACLTLVSGYLRWRLANSFCFLKRRGWVLDDLAFHDLCRRVDQAGHRLPHRQRCQTIIANMASRTAASSIEVGLRQSVSRRRQGSPAIRRLIALHIRFVDRWLGSKTEPGSLAIGVIFGGKLCLEPKNCQFAVLDNMNNPSPTTTLDAHVIRFASHHCCPSFSLPLG